MTSPGLGRELSRAVWLLWDGGVHILQGGHNFFTIFRMFLSPAICLIQCHVIGGYCLIPGECRCNMGWNGTLCDQCMPAEECCEYKIVDHKTASCMLSGFCSS